MAEVHRGIVLPQLKAAILDGIRRAGGIGVTTTESLTDVLAGLRQPNTKTIKAKAHVSSSQGPAVFYRPAHHH